MKIKTGRINTKQLVDLFGTENQKNKYTKDKKLNSTVKERILNKASKFCHIEDLGQGNFIIHKLYGLDREDLILPLKKGLYNYLTPLILSKLVEENDKNNNFKITLPFLGWAKKFEIVNENYNIIKYHQKKSSEYLKINDETMFEYFEKMDDCIKYYLEQCLTTLSKSSGLDLIDFDSIKMVRKQSLSSQHNENGGLDIVTKEWDEIVSDDDRKFVYQCEEKAKEKAGIIDNKEKFYGTKSLIYNSELKKLLKEKNILFMYSAFNIYCKNIDKVHKTLEKFSDINLNDNVGFVNAFNEKFIEYIDKKAKGIQNKEFKKTTESEITPEYLKQYRLVEQYIHDYNRLSELTIKIGTPNIQNDIGIDINDTESIMEKFNINIITN